MIRKLQAKFIFINMLIVTIMLFLIFSIFYISTQRKLERESIQMMSSVAMTPRELPRPTGQSDNVRLPYFCIFTNHDHEIIDTYGELYDLTDEELISSIMDEVSLSSSVVGKLSKYNLRYLKTENPMGSNYVFMDLSNEDRVLKGLLRNGAIIGILAYFIFFGISIFFAKWAVHPIEKAWEQQKQFIADASHELKTPLTVILSDAQLLHEAGCTETERLQLSSGIIAMSHQMRGLVESMLELARIDSGIIKHATTNFSLSELVQFSAMIFEPIFFEKNISFEYEIEPSLEMVGNETQIKQVIEILLDNGVKYTLPDHHAALSLKQTGTGKFLICMRNQGDPIPQSELKNLFKRFYRVDKARSASHSYGLGLSIAESIVHEHHGKIWAESQEGYNCFYVELPKR